MNRIKRLATESPIAFGFAITFVFMVMVIVSAVLGAVWASEPNGKYIGGTIGRVISIAILLAVLSRLGWLGPAGFTRLGRWQTWLLSLPLLAYAIAASAYAMTGNFDFRVSDPALTAVAAVFIMTAAFLEEVAFRGLILHAFVRSWGNTNRGLSKSVVVASLFFGGMHIVNFLGGQPLADALMQGVMAFFLGVFLGALVLGGNSIYPAAFFHGILNLAGYLNLTSNTAEATLSSWLLLGGLMIPLAILGIFVFRGARQRQMALDTV
jgi:membrane protease YdiL (CAAX protease family)